RETRSSFLFQHSTSGTGALLRPLRPPERSKRMPRRRLKTAYDSGPSPAASCGRHLLDDPSQRPLGVIVDNLPVDNPRSDAILIVGLIANDHGEVFNIGARR